MKLIDIVTSKVLFRPEFRKYSTYIFTLHTCCLCPHLILTRSLFSTYSYLRCGRLSNSSLSKGRLLYSFIFVHIFIFRSQATFIFEESSETILLFVGRHSGGSEVGHVPLDVRND